MVPVHVATGANIDHPNFDANTGSGVQVRGTSESRTIQVGSPHKHIFKCFPVLEGNQLALVGRGQPVKVIANGCVQK